MGDDRTLGWDTDDGPALPGQQPGTPAGSSDSPPQSVRPQSNTRPDVTRGLPADQRATAMDRADHHDVQARVEAAVAATECGPSSLPGVDPMLGRVVDGRFEILARIGAGGMGIVYRARQVGIDRTVAVKMLLRELAHDEKVIKRFKVEALAVSRLNHPNTIRIFDFGQADDGTLFFAMEFLDGSSLDDALRRDKTFSARRTMHVLKQIAASLVEAHEKGIVHRDLKPDNVYLTRVGDDVDFVKVLDFGVAKLREADKRQGTVTQAGTIFGTPRYMAPEQCRSMAVDHRADIYALGVIAYEMLVGHAPFDAENPLAILIQHVQEPPPSLAEARPDVEVPDEVEALVLKCLEKSADRRFQNASQLVSAISEIEAHLAGRFERVVYVQGPRQTLATQSRQEAETMAGVMPARVGHRARWAWLAAVLMVAFSGIGIALWTSGILGPSTQEPVQASQVPELVAPQVPVVVQQAPPLVPASVSIRFSSDPDGAEIVQRGRVLGVTPLVADVSFGRASESFTFRKGGYVDALVDTVPDRDGAVSVSLKKAAGRLRTPAQLGGVDLSSGGAPSPVAAPSTAAAPAPAASPAVVAPPLPKKDDGPARVRDLKTF